jgi:hypothetical protein
MRSKLAAPLLRRAAHPIVGGVPAKEDAPRPPSADQACAISDAIAARLFTPSFAWIRFEVVAAAFVPIPSDFAMNGQDSPVASRLATSSSLGERTDPGSFSR